MEGAIVFIIIFVAFFLNAIVAAIIAAQGERGIAGFALGFFFGPLGVLAAACWLKPGASFCPHCASRRMGHASVCPACGRDINAPSATSISTSPATPLRVKATPPPPPNIRFKNNKAQPQNEGPQCPYCGGVVSIPATYVGEFTCPHCRRDFNVE